MKYFYSFLLNKILKIKIKNIKYIFYLSVKYKLNIIFFIFFFIQNIYIFENSEIGIPFINYVSYNNKFQINLH